MARPEWEELKNRLEFSEHKRALLKNRVSKGSIEEDSTLWSFVDLMTLLLILFILFYSHALTRKDSSKNMSIEPPQTAVAQSFQIRKTSATSELKTHDPDQAIREVFETDEENRDTSLEQFEQQVLQTLSEKVKEDFSIRWNQKRLILVLGERIAFNVGEADLLPDFQPTLKQISEFISSQEEYKVTVAGHTDDLPINTARFPSNWELSAIRAVNVAKFMILHGVNPHRISTEGYSAYHPLHPNTTAHNRDTNRRVEITLIKEQEMEKPAEQMEATSARNLSTKPTRAANLTTHPPKRYQPVRGYLF